MELGISCDILFIDVDERVLTVMTENNLIANWTTLCFHQTKTYLHEDMSTKNLQKSGVKGRINE